MTTASASNDDSESVDQFLARIASLKDRRDREDEERTRKLEEEILQGRKERQARRAERARSLSPSKGSPAISVASTTDPKPMASQFIDPPTSLAPHKSAATPTKPLNLKARELGGSPKLPAASTPTQVLATPPKAGDTFMSVQTNATPLSRSGTLSWQQRPSSRDSNSSRPRPLSGISPQTGTARDDAPKSKSTDDLSRSEIAQSLGSKDASWFKQTSDRGLSSAAYRKNQVESESTVDNFSGSKSMRLPGMSRETTAEPENLGTPQGGFERRELPAPVDFDADSAYVRNQVGNNEFLQAQPKNIFAMPLPKSQRLEPSIGRSADVRAEQDRDGDKVKPTNTSERSPSPTKGLGGFVQSAMMKRSDSVNKRWSVQANAGLKRGDSVASNRSTLAAAGAPALLGGPARSPTRASKVLGGDLPSSPLSGSRPSSSHGDDIIAKKMTPSLEMPSSPKHMSAGAETNLIERGRSREVTDRSQRVVEEESLPISPSKTMEPRRWSPTKASWLESALTKPESPKLTSPLTEQPSWKSDLQRSKMTKASQEDATTSTSTSSFNVVSPASLLRSPPLGGHSRPLSISGMPEGFSSGTIKKAAVPSPNPKPAIVNQRHGVDTAKDENSSLEQTTSSSSLKAESEDKRKEDELVPKAESPVVKTAREIPIVKPKPETPPKPDFRANLKSRQDTSSKDNGAEPEFKAVFGKLKRTQTKNYVAPDELKENIARGKAALNLTSGPQKTKHVDEFKESILQKKETMKAGGGSVHGKAASKTPVVPEKPETVLPEALAKRQLLSKPILSKAPMTSSSAEPLPVTVRSKPIVSKSKPQAEKSKNSADIVMASDQNSEAPTKPEPKSLQSGSKELAANSGTTALSSIPDQQNENMNSKLAARLNPALAGFLSRSSSPHLTDSSPARSPTATTLSVPSSSVDKSTDDASALTHMTKARAKGPRRRAPKSEGASTTPVNSSKLASSASPKPFEPVRAKSETTATSMNTPGAPRSLASLMKLSVNAESKSGQDTSRSTTQDSHGTSDMSTPRKIITAQPLVTEPETVEKAEEEQTKPKSKPQVAAKSPELRKVSSPPNTILSDVILPAKLSASSEFNIATDKASKPEPAMSKQTAPEATSKSEAFSNMPLTPSTSKINSPRVVRNQGNEAHRKTPGPPPTPKAKGLGLNFESQSSPKAIVTASEPTPPPEKTLSSTLGERLQPSAKVLEDFFTQMPKASDKGEFETEKLLSTTTGEIEKSKTLKMQIWEISGDGKTQSLPPQQEHILFEECMYLCTHTFENAKGSSRTEVYLWSGDGVADAAVEDAQLFCKKIARDNNAKLEVVQQGKESPLFFQALGGIVITRRSKTSAFYLLCGRRHLGHVAFDEVDFDTSSLCSGFPFIVSAKFGKLYLWKGQGSGAEELGCARLMGMDLCLTGEMEEVNEGQEPAVFFESFPNAKARQRRVESEHWQAKSIHPQYTCRLYRVEHERPKSEGFWGRRGSSPPKSSTKALVTEISPFSQRDLEPSHIYVLDAYFEIYVLASKETTLKSREFVTATHLAQEMSYLAPSVLDRPLMSTCFAVFGEPPTDFTTNFRKWQPLGKATLSQVLPLDDVIESME